MGCDFFRLDIGFAPSNKGWNQSTGDFGMFLYQSDEPSLEKYQELFINGCRTYESEFSSIFINDDRTWKVARVMTYISGAASIFGTVRFWSLK
jgi:hypothetical protein